MTNTSINKLLENIGTLSFSGIEYSNIPDSILQARPEYADFLKRSNGGFFFSNTLHIWGVQPTESYNDIH